MVFLFFGSGSSFSVCIVFWLCFLWMWVSRVFFGILFRMVVVNSLVCLCLLLDDVYLVVLSKV